MNYIDACDYVYKLAKQHKIPHSLEIESGMVPVVEIAEKITDFLNQHIVIHPLRGGEYYSVKIKE